MGVFFPNPSSTLIVTVYSFHCESGIACTYAVPKPEILAPSYPSFFEDADLGFLDPLKRLFCNTFLEGFQRGN